MEVAMKGLNDFKYGSTSIFNYTYRTCQFLAVILHGHVDSVTVVPSISPKMEQVKVPP